jgi:hypothetical protein
MVDGAHDAAARLTNTMADRPVLVSWMDQTLAQNPVVEARADPAVALRKALERQYDACALLRPFHRACYDPGERLALAVTGVIPANAGRAVLEVERFVGGGFAGQVYRVKLLHLDAGNGPIAGLSVGQAYALKILRAPSGFARRFRDFLYFLAYQGAFSAQVNPAAVRVGVLRQKLIRRAAAQRLGSETAVCDTYATFYDENLHSFGELNEWVSGRIWKFEVDDRLFERWEHTGPSPPDHNCPEYVHKKTFMRELVGLLHEMGAPELARQYEWWTCKSQPNALRRLGAEHSPDAGLTAIDFRAGLALLPLLPMSPADFGLIARGLSRGRLVQFDRSDPRAFGRFIGTHRDDFADLQPVIDELRRQEPRYRRSLPDVTHHLFNLQTDAALRWSIKQGAITAWRNLGHVDAEHAELLERRRGPFPLMFVISLLPLVGGVVLKLWGSARRRAHLKRSLTSWDYLCRAMRGARIETLIAWHRRGRLGDERALKLVHRPVRYWLQRILFGWLPARWQRFLTDRAYAWQRLRQTVRFTVQFLRDPPFREEWLLDQVQLGREEGMLTESEADNISRQIKDPYIQKYLKSVAVHLCTLPVTQIVSLGVALYFLVAFRESWQQSLAYAIGVLAFFQVTPISPGSIVRGSYVVYLVVRERNLRDYWVAGLISFWKYIGYLGFPLQMVAHDPALARFLAGRWAKNAVGFVPIFGERGGLLEHAVFDLFFNLPLSVKRDFGVRPHVWITRAVLAVILLTLLVYTLYLHLAA